MGHRLPCGRGRGNEAEKRRASLGRKTSAELASFDEHYPSKCDIFNLRLLPSVVLCGPSGL
jgi:hypothetical protein